MCITREMAEQLVEEFGIIAPRDVNQKTDGSSSSDEAMEALLQFLEIDVAGQVLDFGPEDMLDYYKRYQLVMMSLGIAGAEYGHYYERSTKVEITKTMNVIFGNLYQKWLATRFDDISEDEMKNHLKRIYDDIADGNPAMTSFDQLVLLKRQMSINEA